MSAHLASGAARRPARANARAVVLTGATGGIGRAVAGLLAGRGDRLLLSARDRDALAHLVADLQRRHGAQVEAVAADLCQPAARAALVQAATRFQADALINAAGMPAFGPFAEQDDDRLAESIAVNLIAPLQLARAMIAPLSRQPAADIVNVGSALGRIGVPGFVVYAAAKFGLRGAGEALRRELADTPIRVKTVMPRATRTAFNDGAAARFNTATGTASDDPERVAATIVAALDGRRPETMLGFPERIVARLNGLVPRLFDGAFARHRRALAALRDGPAAVARGADESAARPTAP